MIAKIGEIDILSHDATHGNNFIMNANRIDLGDSYNKLENTDADDENMQKELIDTYIIIQMLIKHTI